MMKALGLDDAAVKAMADAELLTQDSTPGTIQQSLNARLGEGALISRKLGDAKTQLTESQKQQFIAATASMWRAFDKMRSFGENLPDTKRHLQAAGDAGKRNLLAARLLPQFLKDARADIDVITSFARTNQIPLPFETQ
jgi:hypothetical protein